MNAQVIAFRRRCRLCGEHTLFPRLESQRCTNCGAWTVTTKQEKKP